MKQNEGKRRKGRQKRTEPRQNLIKSLVRKVSLQEKKMIWQKWWGLQDLEAQKHKLTTIKHMNLSWEKWNFQLLYYIISFHNVFHHCTSTRNLEIHIFHCRFTLNPMIVVAQGNPLVTIYRLTHMWSSSANCYALREKERETGRRWWKLLCVIMYAV